MSQLFAWARPLLGIPVLPDHTWVTTYPDGFESEPTPDYWFCHGDSHSPNGPNVRTLGSRNANLDVACCICPPNDRAEHAGITYRVDGTCHQIANRILYACDPSDEPLTVQDAAGYVYTLLYYGKYGGDAEEWKRRKRRCSKM